MRKFFLIIFICAWFGFFAWAAEADSPSLKINKDSQTEASQLSLDQLEPLGNDVYSTPAKLIDKALFDILVDLQNLRKEFPQLKRIKLATVQDHLLRYRQGLNRRMNKGKIFQPNGCEIVVEILYPAASEDLAKRTQEGSLSPVLPDGKSFAVFQVVRAESTAQGKNFMKRVQKIIRHRLSHLWVELRVLLGDR